MLFKILKILILLKFSIKRPKKSKIVIFDRSESDIIGKYLKDLNVSYHIIDTRLESLNLYILLKLIFKRKQINFKNYIILYLETIDCSTVLSGIDNNLLFLTLKKTLRDKHFICIQQGWRSPKFIEEKFKNIHNAELTLMFTYSEKFSKMFSKSINSKYVEIGSFKNNQIIKKKKRNSNSIAFISEISVGSRKKYMQLSNYKVKSNDFYVKDLKLIKLISNFCNLNNIHFKIIGKYNHNWEKKYYEKVLKGKNFLFIPNSRERNVYKICDEIDLVVGTFSTLLLENLARGNKTLIFNTKIEPTNDLNFNIFYPNKIERVGDFWTDTVDNNKVREYLERYYNMSNKTWNLILEKNKKLIINFDPGNNIFKENLEKFL